MKQVVPVALVIACCMWSLPVASAVPDPAAIQLAKSHYEKGNASYNLAKYEEAIGWFTKAYEAWLVADFLYNIAQSYRLAGTATRPCSSTAAIWRSRTTTPTIRHALRDPARYARRTRLSTVNREMRRLV